MNRDQRAPAWVRSPRDGGWLAAGEDHDVVGRPGRDPDPGEASRRSRRVARTRRSEHRPALSSVRACLCPGLHSRVSTASVNPAGDGSISRPSSSTAAAPPRRAPGRASVQQRGLADAAWAVHEKYPAPRKSGQRIVERTQLGPAADKAPSPRQIDDVTQAARRHQPSFDPVSYPPAWSRHDRLARRTTVLAPEDLPNSGLRRTTLIAQVAPPGLNPPRTIRDRLLRSPTLGPYDRRRSWASCLVKRDAGRECRVASGARCRVLRSRVSRRRTRDVPNTVRLAASARRARETVSAMSRC